MKLRTLSLIAVVGTLALGACGNDDTASNDGPTDQTGFNDADVAFAQGMIPHHEQAIEMADIALDPTVGTGEQVRDLATRIKGAQDPEIVMMTGWLTGWAMELDMGDGHDMSSMEGMMSVAEMDELAALTGAEFDAKWLNMMIRHHEGAISMAELVRAEGSNAEVRTLADQIVAAQESEIAEMQELVGS